MSFFGIRWLGNVSDLLQVTLAVTPLWGSSLWTRIFRFIKSSHFFQLSLLPSPPRAPKFSLGLFPGREIPLFRVVVALSNWKLLEIFWNFYSKLSWSLEFFGTNNIRMWEFLEGRRITNNSTINPKKFPSLLIKYKTPQYNIYIYKNPQTSSNVCLLSMEWFWYVPCDYYLLFPISQLWKAPLVAMEINFPGWRFSNALSPFRWGECSPFFP